MAAQRTLLDGGTGQKFESLDMLVGEAVDSGGGTVELFSENATQPFPLTSGAPAGSYMSPVAFAPDDDIELLIVDVEVEVLGVDTVDAADSRSLDVTAGWGNRFSNTASLLVNLANNAGAGIRNHFSARLVLSGGKPNVADQPVTVTFGAVGLTADETLTIDADMRVSVSRAVVAEFGQFSPVV